MASETWTFINTFAPWLSAVGTIAAVIVSLWLANRDRRVRLKVNAGLKKLLWAGQNLAQGNDIVLITITNVGYRAARIDSIYWKVGFFKKTDIV